MDEDPRKLLCSLIRDQGISIIDDDQIFSQLSQ